MTEDTILKRHLADLSRRAEDGGYYVYSDFLSPADAAELTSARREGIVGAFTLYGGFEGAERRIAAFGNEGELGYPPEYPALWLAISPVAQKFADSLTHRDFLGTLMGLGIERDLLGDIVIHENVGYLYALESVSAYLCENLTKVKHTAVTCRVVEAPPSVSVSLPEKEVFVVAAERLDAMIASVYRLSRSEAVSLIEKGLVALDGRVSEKPSVTVKEGNTVSVRGYGRFLYCGILGDTRKGKLRMTARVYK